MLLLLLLLLLLHLGGYAAEFLAVGPEPGQSLLHGAVQQVPARAGQVSREARAAREHLPHLAGQGRAGQGEVSEQVSG